MARRYAARVALACLAGTLAACQPPARDSDAQATETAAADADASDAPAEVVTDTQVADAPFGAVRIEQVAISNASHADSGRLAISYLDGDKVVKSYPKAVELGSFGAMSGFRIDRSFSDYPMVIAEGGGTWQGQTCAWTVLTELRPDGPVKVAEFESDYDNSGAVERSPTSIKGEITDVMPDQSFKVAFTGTRNFTALYVRDGDKGYKLQGSKDQQLTGC
ncbi:hypothetical protein [Novosphingobium album (ex Liu et al. 2023)]|uniref:Lipoprotein n=1 Tax=Novosphingobium album (ex Liu et al. 2023) TaxID=3031130 RepID=A0ABT5WWZ2_9SPHN|nr:hypothetical protein [Novosphingobium album (ex Liu et al. 2023)]MDE8654374.1 hypothetical protein [Novosphingobium album (ex Liu et al. 2023)]